MREPTMTATLDDFYVDESEIDFALAGAVAPEPTGNYDRYILPISNEPGAPTKEMTRTTTIASGMDDGFGLGTWSLYRAIWGVAQRDDFIASLRALDINAADSRPTLREIADKAKLIAGTDAASNWGTAAHGVLQRVDKGEGKSTIHEYWHPLIDNYLLKLERAGLSVVPNMIERVCRCVRYDIGGRFDNIYMSADGSYLIGDKKTKGDPDDRPLSVSMQLGIYANSEQIMDYVTGRYEGMLPVRTDYAVMVHIDRDTMDVEILRVNIAHGWECVRVEIERRELRKRKQLVFPYAPGIGAANQHGVLHMHQAADRMQLAEDPPRAASNGQPNPTVVTAIQSEIYGRVNEHRPPGTPPVGPGMAAAPAPSSSAGTQPPAATVGPTAAVEQPPTPATYVITGQGPVTAVSLPAGPEVQKDAQLRVADILGIRKNDKARLQGWLRDLDGTDLNHHRKWLAEEIVKRTPGSNAVEPPAVPQASTTTVSHPGGPIGQPVVGPGTAHPVTAGIDAVVDMTAEQVIRDIGNAATLSFLSDIWQRWTATYGAGSWQGPVKEAAEARANFIRSQSQPAAQSGDDGPPF
jgi:hypothetical protein